MILTLFIIRGNIRDQTMELKLIKNNGFTPPLWRWAFLVWELIDFHPFGFNQINRKIACVRCSRETYYDVKELENHEVNFVELWTET